MQLYHGSPTPGIQTLEPRMSNHGKPYVYLTDSPDLAVMHAGAPRWGTYYYKDGQLHYDEYFPNQLEEFFGGKSGYVYTCQAEGLERLDKMPWVYLSEEPVPVAECRFVPDIHGELLRLIEAGRIIFHPFDSLSEQRREGIYRMITRRVIEEGGLRDKPESEEAQFVRRHFPHLL